MLLQVLLLFFLLLLLFFLSQRIHTIIYLFIFSLTRNKQTSLVVLALLLLPGTIIHELSHFLFATFLRVPAGPISIFPTIEKNDEVRAGKLFIAKTDPFRHILIGLAPLIIGLIMIYLTGKIYLTNFPQLPIANYQLFIGLYLLFTISITMFSSKKDLESLVISGPIIILILSSLYLSGVRIFLTEALVRKLELILTDLNYYLLAITILDYLILLLLQLPFYLRKIRP